MSFNSLISLGKLGLIILHLKSGPNLGPRIVIRFHKTNCKNLAFNQSGGAIRQLLLHKKKPLMRSRLLAASMDLLD